jgi:hypothetical protein
MLGGRWMELVLIMVSKEDGALFKRVVADWC